MKGGRYHDAYNRARNGPSLAPQILKHTPEALFSSVPFREKGLLFGGFTVERLSSGCNIATLIRGILVCLY